MVEDSYSRRQYVTLGAALVASGFAGCTSRGGSDTNEITIWTDAWDSQVPTLQKRIEKRSGVEVTFTDMRYDTIKQQFLTGGKTGTPDIVEATPNHRGDYVSAGLLEPLTDRVNELDYKDGYIGLDTMTYKDDLWALPYIGNGRGLVYRQDIMNEYGGVPDDWSTFIEMASDITKGEQDMHGFTLTTQKGNTRMLQEFLSFLFQRVDSIFEPTGDGWTLVASREDFGQVFKHYYWDPFYATDPPATNPNARGIGSIEHDIAYVNGNYASISTGPWIPGVVQGSDNASGEAMENYRKSAVAHNPRIKGGKIGTYMEVKPVFLNKNSENKNAAWKAIKMGTSPKGIGMYLESYPGNLPAHTDAEWTVPEQTSNPNWKTFKDVFNSGKSYGFWSVSKLSDAFFDLSQKVVYDRIDPMKAGKRLYKQWSKKASEI